MTNETIADIIAEMRGVDNKCQLATKDGTGCYHCPFGSAASNCVFDNYADRLEAALKRETDCIHRAMVLIAGIEMESPEDPPRLWTALEDAYDALSDALGTDGDTTDDEEEARANGRHFVIQPHGDAAKLREALETVRKYVKETTPDKVLLGVIEVWCDAALAAPPRNCDVGTAKEQVKRWRRFCNSMTTCGECPCRKSYSEVVADCFSRWAQMPYDEEGGAK